LAKEKGRQWDGKSRVSNDTYRKRFDEIFGKRKMVTVKKENNVTIEVEESLLEGFEEEQEYLKELEDKL
jgi:hypothetical protein